MSRQIIQIANAPSSPLYSQAIKVGRQALINCQNILHAADASLENVVEVQVLLARPGDFAGPQ